MGRNGAGKSRFLRGLADALDENPAFRITYVSPERAGTFIQDPSMETNIQRSPGWLRSVRNKNQAGGFKNVSAYYLRQLETAFLRKMEGTPELRSDHSKSFVTEHLNKINSMLLNVSIERELSDNRALVFKNSLGSAVNVDDLSSGESEVFALASEVIYFFATTVEEKINVLFLDEPDVHLHSDLQANFARFLIDQFSSPHNCASDNVLVVVATHSTSLICELASSSYTSIGTKHFDVDVVKQKLADSTLKKAAPFFAHPLSKSIRPG